MDDCAGCALSASKQRNLIAGGHQKIGKGEITGGCGGTGKDSFLSEGLSSRPHFRGMAMRQNPLLFFGYFIGYFKRKQGLKQDNLTGLLDSATL